VFSAGVVVSDNGRIDHLDGPSGVHARLSVVETRAEGHAAALDNIEAAMREHALLDAKNQEALLAKLDTMQGKADARHDAVTTWSWRIVIAIVVLSLGSPLATEAVKAAIEHGAAAVP